ncbi:hypothetical protein PMAYCL1PPCAC_30598 [Pristionchus mayeri]|uniref:Uncharacterized protein n=1 Tax=Pristionchus mayeri TaxID=1317129 RepID=A0AAN5IBU7_9BILA|nr:hypothetical protein PMAYCL1PPCAC_30598 [Pristionchus mayeri]
MINRAKQLNYNNRYLVLFYGCLAVLSIYIAAMNLPLIFSRDVDQLKRDLQNDSLNASPNGVYFEIGEEFKMYWDEPRTPEELESLKFSHEDRVIQAKTSQYGYRFGFVPTEADVDLKDYNRISIRFDFNITEGRTMSRVFVQIMEIDKSHAGIPFAGFHYKNLSPISSLNKSMEIPIPPSMMREWREKEFAEICFILKYEFGVLSNVRNVTTKLPVLVFSRTKRPTCNQDTCCLSANRTIPLTRRPVYKNLIQPLSTDHQRCIECIRTSEPYDPDMGNLGMYLHDKYTLADVPVPTQLGRCRATDWSDLQVIVKDKEGNVNQINYPYFKAEECECVEGEISPDYLIQQENIDHAKRIAIMKAKTTKSP